MLDKNHDVQISYDIQKMKQILEQKTMNLILHSDPFIKTIFLEQIIQQSKIPIIYLDFDLLYSGYIKTEILFLHTKNFLFQPTKKNWNDLIKEIIFLLASEKSIVIIDSLNGFFNIFEKKTSRRIVYSYIMLFYQIATMNDSKILLTKTNQKDLDVIPTIDRQILDLEKLNIINLEHKNTTLSIHFKKEENNLITFSFPITAELR